MLTLLKTILRKRKIRKHRSIRNAFLIVLQTENPGRKRRLLNQFIGKAVNQSFVIEHHIGAFQTRIDLELGDGYEFISHGDSRNEAVGRMVKKVFEYYLKRL